MGKFAVYYLIFINVLSALVCISDKIKASRHKWRIKEATLWLFSMLGGSLGMYITMRIIQHKTLHKSFMIGLPVLIIFQVSFILVLTKYFGGHIMFA